MVRRVSGEEERFSALCEALRDEAAGIPAVVFCSGPEEAEAVAARLRGGVRQGCVVLCCVVLWCILLCCAGGSVILRRRSEVPITDSASFFLPCSPTPP